MKKIILASLAACLVIGSAATSANAMTRAQWWALHHPSYAFTTPMPAAYVNPLAVNPFAVNPVVYPPYPVYHPYRYYHRYHHYRVW